MKIWLEHIRQKQELKAAPPLVLLVVEAVVVIAAVAVEAMEAAADVVNMRRSI